MGITSEGRLVQTGSKSTIRRGRTSYDFYPGVPLWVPEEDAVDILKSPEFREVGGPSETDSPKICWVISNLGLGGAERHTLDLLASFKHHNWEHSVLCLDGRRATDVLLKEFEKYATVYYGRNVVMKFAEDADLVVLVCCTKKDFKVRSAWKTPTVCIIHSVMKAPEMENTFYVVPSETARDAQTVESLLIPNGVDYKFWSSGSSVRKRMNISAGDFVTLYVGRLSEEKGVELLLRAVSRVGCRLIIAGTGPEEETLKGLAEQWGMKDSVSFRGYIPPEGIRNLLRSSDCLVLPSRSESAPLSILEAMAAGCPVIATNVGDIPKMLVGGEAGYLFEPGDEEALVKILSESVDGLTELDTKAKVAASIVYNNYSYRSMSAMYHSLFGYLVGCPLVVVGITSTGEQIHATMKSVLKSTYTNIRVIYSGVYNYVSSDQYTGRDWEYLDSRVEYLLTGEDDEIDNVNVILSSIYDCGFLLLLRAGNTISPEHIEMCVVANSPIVFTRYDDGEVRTVLFEDGKVADQILPQCCVFTDFSVVRGIQIPREFPNFWPLILVVYAETMTKEHKSFIHNELTVSGVDSLDDTPANVDMIEKESGYVAVLNQIRGVV